MSRRPTQDLNRRFCCGAITWKEVERICAKLNGLNPYDKEIVHDILKIEDCNRGRDGKPRQLHGVAISAKICGLRAAEIENTNH